MSLHEVWPVFGLRVRSSGLELFVPDETTLVDIARLAARGIYDPQNQYLPRTPVGGWEDVASPEAERRFLRYYWASLADWRPERWNLVLGARAGDQIVGVRANTQPAYGCYLTEPAAVVGTAAGLIVLTTTGERVSGMTRFLDNTIMAWFGLPLTMTTVPTADEGHQRLPHPETHSHRISGVDRHRRAL